MKFPIELHHSGQLIGTIQCSSQWLDVSKESASAFSFLPMAMKITTTNAQQTAQVDFTLTTARYDVIPSYPFKIDDSYKRQTLPLK